MHKYFDNSLFQPFQIEELPHPSTNVIIVIPACDEPNFKNTIHSLLKCNVTNGIIEVLVIFNYSEYHSLEKINKIIAEYEYWEKEFKLISTDQLFFLALKAFGLRKKWGGVGLARKIGLDEAAYRLLSISKPKSPLIWLDADTLVPADYLIEIERLNNAYNEFDAFGFRFEHDLILEDGGSHIEILEYELHLRYFVLSQKFIKLPFAFQTIGSAIGVRANSYILHNGMNKRKAGEDFYFAHKFIQINKYVLVPEIVVFPSSRISDRVPFGTGAMMNKLRQSPGLLTYAFEGFQYLEKFISNLLSNKEYLSYSNLMKDVGEPVLAFLESNDFENKHAEALKNTSSFDSFLKRFFRHFDAFTLMKYSHFIRDNYIANQPILNEMNKLGHAYFNSTKETEIEWVQYLRKLKS